MTENRSNSSPPDPHAPYGTQPRRSNTPLFLLAALYVCWLLALLWMAMTQVGR
jgi:hypothetical protein